MSNVFAMTKNSAPVNTCLNSFDATWNLQVILLYRILEVYLIPRTIYDYI